NNRLYVPRTFEPTLLASIRFPNEETPDSSLDNSKLFHTLEKFLEKYVDLDWEARFSIVLFAVSTWLADRLDATPYLLVTGPQGSGKTTLLKFLSCICRRSLLVSDVPAHELCSLPLFLRPTLLLDETYLSQEFSRLLRAGYSRGLPVLRKGRMID